MEHVNSDVQLKSIRSEFHFLKHCSLRKMLLCVMECEYKQLSVFLPENWYKKQYTAKCYSFSSFLLALF